MIYSGMEDKTWQRARNKEQIRQRKEEILSAAEDLFRKEPFNNVTMQKIARKAGCSQSNTYRYFQNKEDVFLTLYLHDAEKWLDDLDNEFQSEIPLKEFSSKWVEVLLRHERLLEFLPMLDLILEHNSSEKVYYAAKKRFKEKFPQAISSVQKALPCLTEEKAADFLYIQQALVAGLRPMTQYSEMQKKVLEELEIHKALQDFSAFFQKALHNYLKGLVQE